MPDDKSDIPRTNDSHPSGDKPQREHLPGAANIAPDSDGLVCEQCGNGIDKKYDIRIISVNAEDGLNYKMDLCRIVICPHCYEIAVDRIKNILGKVV